MPALPSWHGLVSAHCLCKDEQRQRRFQKGTKQANAGYGMVALRLTKKKSSSLQEPCLKHYCLPGLNTSLSHPKFTFFFASMKLLAQQKPADEAWIGNDGF